MDYTRSQIAQACAEYGHEVGPLPVGVDGAQLLWAISGNESSFGANCTPRHEPAFDVGGPYADAKLLEKFGSAAACSYGPWQIMLANCPDNYTPADMNDLDNAAIATILFLNKQLNRFTPSTLAAIGAIWNGGNPHALEHPAVLEYAHKLQTNFTVPMEVA